MNGRFIISLDCEGKWGMADKLTPYHDRLLTDDALARVYADIIGLFGAYEMPATFAFVLAFTMDLQERQRFARLFEVDDSRSGGWLSHFHEAQRTGQLGGWFQPQALEIVRQHAQHEIACHGFCHRSLADGALSIEDAHAELDAAEEIAVLKGVSLRTLVYPRNDVGHLAVLAQKGYLGYRARRPRPRALGRLGSLVEELDIWPRPETAARPARDELVRIPAGYFFNWRFGARRRIPPAITVRRWKTLLDRTVERGGVAHLWLHPHNLITAPETRDTLESVLAHAARHRATGCLRVLTQEAYCRELLQP